MFSSAARAAAAERASAAAAEANGRDGAEQRRPRSADRQTRRENERTLRRFLTVPRDKVRGIWSFQGMCKMKTRRIMSEIEKNGRKSSNGKNYISKALIECQIGRDV